MGRLLNYPLWGARCLGVCLLAVAALGGCAPRAAWRSTIEFYWPTPPEKPRVKFVGLLRSSNDVAADSLLVTLFGKDVPVEFVKPFDVAVRDGVVYATDLGRILVFDTVRERFSIIGEGELAMPVALAVAADGTLWVGDSSLHAVVAYGPDGRQKMLIRRVPGAEGESPWLGVPAGLDVDDEAGILWVTDARRHALFAYNLEGTFLFKVGGKGKDPGNFNMPYDVSVCPDGLAYVTDSGNFRVQVFDRQGSFVREFGGIGRVPGTFARPKGVGCDADGHVYIADAAFGNVQIVDALGTPLLVVGAPGAGIGEFLLPAGVDVDRDMIYVADQLNRRIQVFRYLGGD